MNIKNIWIVRVVLVFVALIMLPACKQSSSDSLKKKRQPSLQHVEFKVDGVECDLCAQAAVDAVKHVEGVCDAAYYVEREQYEDGFMQLAYDETTALSYDDIRAAVEAEGFSALL